MNLTKKKLWEVTIWDKKFQNVDLFKQESIKKYKYFLAKEIDKFVHSSKTNEENVIDAKIRWSGKYIVKSGVFFLTLSKEF
ncbi:hypothetical protein, partial [Mycoplasmopsis columboralis]|uniref:hypothetical protein n=1 Tax=Mycoplasmopsis columboralis TaxID=171282 RepID=UPI0018D56D04